MSASSNTTSVTRVGWVTAPTQRGTIDIIYASVLVLAISVWTVLHPNIPARSEGQWATVRRKILWAFLGIASPEILTLFAASQWGMAKTSVREMRNLGKGEWSMVHAFYANAGGFVLHSPDYPPFPINARSIHYLCSHEFIECPHLSRRDIWDHSKADLFAKVVALTQAAWLLIQTIARAVLGLAVTPLELFAVAFVFPTVATAFFWFSKPQNVNEPSIVTIDRPVTDVLNAAEAAKKWGPWEDSPFDFVEKPAWQGWGRTNAFKNFAGLESRPIARIPDDYVAPPTAKQSLVVWAVSLVHVAVHIAGWSFSFSTRAELLVWRCSSLVLLFLMLTGGLIPVISTQPWFKFKFSLLWIWVQEIENKAEMSPTWLQKNLIHIVSEFAYVAYIVARICILVEICISFRSMPSEVYVAIRWTAILPHVG